MQHIDFDISRRNIEKTDVVTLSPASVHGDEVTRMRKNRLEAIIGRAALDKDDGRDAHPTGILSPCT